MLPSSAVNQASRTSGRAATVYGTVEEQKTSSCHLLFEGSLVTSVRGQGVADHRQSQPNINQASEEELMTPPSIRESKAATDIVRYREAN